MNRLLVIVLFFSSKLFAQVNIPELLDNKFYTLNILVNSPVSKYRNDIETTLSKTGSVGMSGSYYFNPRYSKTMSNKVFFGVETGFVGNKQNNFSVPMPNGDFYINHREVWLNLGILYRPNVWATNFNPYFEALIGPKMFVSNFNENYGEDEVEKLYGSRSIASTYTIGSGLGYKILSNELKATYITLGVRYSGSNPVKVLNKNAVGIDKSNNVFSNDMRVRPQNLIFTVGISSFL